MGCGHQGPKWGCRCYRRREDHRQLSILAYVRRDRGITFSPKCLRKVVIITQLSLVPRFVAAWEFHHHGNKLDSLQRFCETKYQHDLNENSAGDCHNLINKSVNRIPPTTSAIQTRLLALRETHCIQTLEENTSTFRRLKNTSAGLTEARYIIFSGEFGLLLTFREGTRPPQQAGTFIDGVASANLPEKSEPNHRIVGWQSGRDNPAAGGNLANLTPTLAAGPPLEARISARALKGGYSHWPSEFVAVTACII